MNNWEQQVKDLEYSLFGNVRLIADGYKLTIERGFLRRRIVLLWFVDGIWKGEYSNASSEIGAKFGHPHYYRPTRKDIEFAKLVHRINNRKINKSTRFDEKKYKVEQIKVLSYFPYHPSAASLIRTLKRTCKDIQLAPVENEPAV